jgi:adenylate cyclase
VDTSLQHPWELRVFENHQLVWTTEIIGPAVLGRQSQGEPEPYYATQEAGSGRVIFARFEETTYSRKCLLVEPLAGEQVRLSNLSAHQPIRLNDHDELKPQATLELPLPVLLVLGSRALRLDRIEMLDLQTLAAAPQAPGRENKVASLLPLSRAAGTALQAESLVQWLQATLEVMQSAANSSDFFDRAALAVVQLVGLDSARVLLLQQGEWTVKACQRAPQVKAEPKPPSRQVLLQVCQEKRTFWQVPNIAGEIGSSLAGVQAVVAAPILNQHGEVIGALYGDRGRGQLAAALTRTDAMLVEVLASGVAAGLTRLQQEQATVAARVQFEQFFTPELARNLEAHPDLLAGRDAEVTLLFCDIRGFSRVSERLGPERTVAWISDIMEELSGCVLAEKGVLVDYVGDELMAMWGAPDEQPDHAQRACRAGLAMLERLPAVNERWQAVLGEPLGLGIGINSGLARVGNTGSRRKFKYGPLGNTVNLASRVQGATKYFKVKLLVTGSTRARLDESLPCRRLGRIRVVNIAEPVELFELAPEGQADWVNLHQVYEEALTHFERREFAHAARLVGGYLVDHPGDGPSLILLARAANALAAESADFDPIWELPGK